MTAESALSGLRQREPSRGGQRARCNRGVCFRLRRVLARALEPAKKRPSVNADRVSTAARSTRIGGGLFLAGEASPLASHPRHVGGPDRLSLFRSAPDQTEADYASSKQRKGRGLCHCRRTLQ
jgi:hypothetical protein